ncbi:unnamed protein product [Scytosiphon promiscuus]
MTRAQNFVRQVNMQADLTGSEVSEFYDEMESNARKVSSAASPIDFPTFGDWSFSKRLQLNSMSEDQADADSVYVVVKDGSDMENYFQRCRLCSERFKLVFNQDEEEWVYARCKVLHGQPYHFPICWEYAHEC